MHLSVPPDICAESCVLSGLGWTGLCTSCALDMVPIGLALFHIYSAVSVTAFPGRSHDHELH